MSTKAIQFHQLVWQIKRVFQRLNSESNDFLERFGLTVSQRTVLEFLDFSEPETLANMARANDVSRQHIQQIVNDLLANDLVESVENPAHKRSFLVRRTAKGQKIFRQIKDRESQLFMALVQQFNQDDIETARRTLKAMNDFLHSTQWQTLKQEQLVDE